MREQLSQPIDWGASPAHYQEYRKRIEAEQVELKTFFKHYLPAELQPEQVMSFCAGLANEEQVLRELYGEDTDIVSFDGSERIIQLVGEFGLKRKSLIRLDMKDLESYFQQRKFDLIIGRNIPLNPDYRPRSTADKEAYPDEWPTFLESIKKYLAQNGYLLMTFAREDEFERAKEILKDLKFKLLVQEKNRFIIPSDGIGVAGADVKDNYVILAQRNA